MYDDTLLETDVDLVEADRPQVANNLIAKSKARIKAKRKQKVSRIPADYDPFAHLSALPVGHTRPPQKCWVNNGTTRPVTLADLSPLWRQDIATMGTSDRKHRFLASIVAVVDGDFYVRRKSNGLWISKKTRSEVKNILWNEWGGTETDLNIRKESIKDFMSEDSFLVLDQLIYIPGAGSFVEYKGKKCLNSYYEAPMSFPEDARISDETNLLMEMIVNNLIGHDGGDIAEWTDAMFDPEPSAIRWVFHWLASLYQRPGHAHSTVLWFIGPAQGVGKGRFTSGLHFLLGASNVKTASAEEFKSDWSDSLMGASVFLMDEIDFSSRKEANSKLKRLVSNDTVSLRKRNHGEFEIPAVASYVFTSNNVRPLALDRDDRRNTFFHTVGSQASKDRARKYYELGSEGWKKAWEGLAELLSLIEIDDALISKSFDTEIKYRMIASGLNPFDEWFSSDAVRDTWKVGEFAPSAWIKEKYVEWAKENAFRNCATTSYCQDKLNELESEGGVSSQIRKTLHDNSKPRGHIRLGLDAGDIDLTGKDCEVIALYRERTNIVKMKNAILENRSNKVKTKVANS